MARPSRGLGRRIPAAGTRAVVATSLRGGGGRAAKGRSCKAPSVASGLALCAAGPWHCHLEGSIVPWTVVAWSPRHDSKYPAAATACPKAGYRNEILPPPTWKAGSFLRSRMQVAFGVFRFDEGVVSSGWALLRPSQNSLVEILAPTAFLRSHSSAADAKRDRRPMAGRRVLLRSI